MAISKAAQPPEPPPPPEIKRRIQFNPTQAIGMPLIALVPIIGLFGFFDTSPKLTTAEANGVALEVRYPSRFRHKNGEPMQITAENKTGAQIPKLVVRLSERYVDAFQNPTFIPEPQEIVNGYLVFEFPNVEPGEKRNVEFEMEASKIGSHSALVMAGPKDGQGARLQFDTFILP